ncbi:hypothetical protein COCCU_00065 [Corynebacterium occultum]|uniref:DUF3566 domain-containing protein n=1 Tax=Corynebacterium occultum TaxID=2675219 RepID=A0A6B8VXB6_9CORY|nr:DUF3566 domain-containing protein [Corynebacterium occultum]QGU05984.1 hypothetical protein COCCU_00065 [Corynebacterium occultum]
MATREVAVTRVNPLSAFRVALAMSLVGLVAWLLCVAILFFGMQAFGIWDQVNSVVAGVGGEQAIGFGMIISISALIGAIGAILISVLAPLVAIIYNALVDLFGGITVTLQEGVDE